MPYFINITRPSSHPAPQTLAQVKYYQCQQCTTCELIFGRKKALKRHISSTHPATTESSEQNSVSSNSSVKGPKANQCVSEIAKKKYLPRIAPFILDCRDSDAIISPPMKRKVTNLKSSVRNDLVPEIVDIHEIAVPENSSSKILNAVKKSPIKGKANTEEIYIDDLDDELDISDDLPSLDGDSNNNTVVIDQNCNHESDKMSNEASNFRTSTNASPVIELDQDKDKQLFLDSVHLVKKRDLGFANLVESEQVEKPTEKNQSNVLVNDSEDTETATETATEHLDEAFSPPSSNENATFEPQKTTDFGDENRTNHASTKPKTKPPEISTMRQKLLNPVIPSLEQAGTPIVTAQAVENLLSSEGIHEDVQSHFEDFNTDFTGCENTEIHVAEGTSSTTEKVISHPDEGATINEDNVTQKLSSTGSNATRNYATNDNISWRVEIVECAPSTSLDTDQGISSCYKPLDLEPSKQIRKRNLGSNRKLARKTRKKRSKVSEDEMVVQPLPTVSKLLSGMGPESIDRDEHRIVLEEKVQSVKTEPLDPESMYPEKTSESNENVERKGDEDSSRLFTDEPCDLTITKTKLIAGETSQDDVIVLDDTLDDVIETSGSKAIDVALRAALGECFEEENDNTTTEKTSYRDCGDFGVTNATPVTVLQLNQSDQVGMASTNLMTSSSTSSSHSMETPDPVTSYNENIPSLREISNNILSDGLRVAVAKNLLSKNLGMRPASPVIAECGSSNTSETTSLDLYSQGAESPVVLDMNDGTEGTEASGLHDSWVNVPKETPADDDAVQSTSTGEVFEENTVEETPQFIQHDGRYVCCTCGKSYVRIGPLRKHLIGHVKNSSEHSKNKSSQMNSTEERPTCNTCGKSFKNNLTLLKHLTSDHKSYQCVGCGTLFFTPNELGRHHGTTNCGKIVRGELIPENLNLGYGNDNETTGMQSAFGGSYI